MLSFLHKYAKNYTFSQNGEEGIILEALVRMGVNSGHCVEIGGNDGRFCSNTALLLQNEHWSGLFVEGDYSLYLKSKENWKDNPRVRHQCCYVDGKNINAFVHDDCDLLSLDTDGSDYEIFRGLEARPKIVIAEIDSSIPPDSYAFNSDGAAGYLAMLRLGRDKGYFLLCHTGNMIFVRSEYWASHFPDISAHPEMDAGQYFNRAWLI